MADERCDIVIPVYNGLNYVSACLESILKYTDYPYSVIVVDDCSDSFVRKRLSEYEREYPQIRVLYNGENLGFVKTANRGIKESTGKYVVILNSDTFVTPSWLGRMIRCAESDPRIGVVNPISNMAVNLSVQMPPGLNIFTMDERIQEVSRRAYPDIVTPVGFCFLIKREIIERFGGFDEVYGRGYCEESDYCMKLVDAGYRTVAADDVFVYHKGCASFGQWQERYIENRKIFDSRWKELYERLYSEFQKKDPLGYLRRELTRGTTVPRLDTTGMKELWDAGRNIMQREGIRGVISRVPTAVARFAEVAKGMAATMLTSREYVRRDPSLKQNLYVTEEYIKRLPRGRGLRVAFLIYKFGASGGVISVLQIANEMIKRGHTAYLVTLSEEPEPGLLNMYTRPIRYRSLEDMASFFPPADVVVATFWPTAYYWLPEIMRKNSGLASVYFLQDYEAWFYPESKGTLRQKVIDSYRNAHHLIVKTEWLKEKLKEHGYSAHKIHLGLNLEVFYPRDNKYDTAKKRILFQARPFEKVRGFEKALKVFEKLLSRRDDIEVVFFGCREEDLSQYQIPFPYTNMGIVHDQNRVAELYSSCHLLFDCSLFHGFGRPGLEAMACGVPTVLTKEGGIREYAKDWVNTVLVDPTDIEGMVEAIISVLDDEGLRERLIKAGLETAKSYCHRDEARLHIEFYSSIVKDGAKR